jgi:hypothetical protein
MQLRNGQKLSIDGGAGGASAATAAALTATPRQANLL